MDNKAIIKSEIKILLLEDYQADSELVRELLRSEGYTGYFKSVSTESAFVEELKNSQYDLILSDYNLPSFNGMEALRLAQTHLPEVPFICVSGSIGEDRAVELLKNKATDYVLKDQLEKLPLAVSRALKEAQELLALEAAQKELHRLSQAVMQSPSGVIISDTNGKIEYINPRFTEISGYPPEMVVGKTVRILKEESNSPENFNHIWETIRSGKVWKGEYFSKRRSGERYWEYVAISPLLNEGGEIISYTINTEDITEQKRLTQELIQAKEKAEAGDKLKTAFMQNISHEVRTPLNGILGFASLIAQPNLSEENRKNYLNILNTSSDRLLNTITNYMDISLIASGSQEIHKKPFLLADLFSELNYKFQPIAEAKKITLNLLISKEVVNFSLNSDEALLKKSFAHLLDNAIKFTSEGQIDIGFEIADDKVNLFVSDTGTGIDKENQISVFKFFMQENTSINRGYEGSGLGLSIAQGFIQLLNGTITMESEKGIGSRFTISIPVETLEPPNSMAHEHQNPIISPTNIPTILIAEDDELNYLYTKTVLEEASFAVIRAANGKEAVEVCLTHPEVALVLMDIKMPVQDGYEATKHIKQQSKNMPIIALTAYAMVGDRQKALDAGCDDYLSKPVIATQLLDVVAKFIILSTSNK
ncbi:MAG TPA: response regulator [Williamwhitmania sp.]|nr:response regulator [Williamwhitmania sp.]